jgi:hypothetical protein
VQIGYPGNVTFIAGVPYIKYTSNDYPFGYGPRVRPPQTVSWTSTTFTQVDESPMQGGHRTPQRAGTS